MGYVKEWDSVIKDPETEELNTRNVLFPELGTPYLNLPHEIEEMYKLLRMSVRVTQELPKILVNIREDPTCREIAFKILEKESESGHRFQGMDVMETSVGLLKLGQMYFSFPSKIYSPSVFQEMPLKDILSVALLQKDELSLREPLKWLTFAHEVLKNRTHSPKEEIYDEGEEEKGTKLPSEEGIHLNITKTYLDIATDIISFKHDYALKIGDCGDSDNNLFAEAIAKVSVKDQSTSTFKKDEEIEEGTPTYEQLCKGIHSKNLYEDPKVSCWYDDLEVPFLRLMPVMVEAIVNDPRILFFHRVLTDDTINKLQQLSLPLQQKSTTYNFEDEERPDPFLIRSSYVKPLGQRLDRSVKALDRLSGYLTGLEVLRKSDSESIQLNVYKPGGHYTPHMDAFADSISYLTGTNDKREFELATKYSRYGDRIATLLYYLNDVKYGGRTAFTELGVSIKPEKGGALLWFSLFNSGEVDYRTRHAGCPVLSGIKWVVNKWIRYNSQLFRRPCSLHQANIVE